MIQPSDFQRESFRIDEQIWDAMALRAGETALFLGLANDGAWIARAVEIGVRVSAVGGDDETLARIGALGATAIRGSATLIPARDESFDVAVAFHYLHEIDPGFHAQVVHELARVGRRVVIVEPSPPADPLGRRIAALYSRAKRDAGQFEQYQPLEYWRKLLAIVKAEVWQSLFTFTRVPPKHAVAETVSLILSAMAIEDLPQQYLDELRTLARRPDTQLLPLSRIVLVATPPGEALPQGDGTKFRPNAEIAPPPPASAEPVAMPTAPPPPPHYTPLPAGARGEHEWRLPQFGIEPELPEFPPVPAPAAPTLPPPPPAAPPLQQPPPAPFGAPFAVPEEDDVPFGGSDAPDAPSSGFGWSWEPPEDDTPGP